MVTETQRPRRHQQVHRAGRIAPWVALGSVTIAFTIAVLVGWSIMFTKYYFLATRTQASQLGFGYWILLSVGCLLLTAVITTVVLFVISNVRKTLLMRQQDLFVDSVTHELRSPLAGMLLSIDTLARHDLADGERADFLRRMRGEALRLQSFVERVLNAASLEQRRFDTQSVPVALLPLVERCRAEVERANVDADGRIDIVVSPADAVAITDPIALNIIVTNLLDNAVKYSPGKTPVRLRATVTPAALQLAVQDQGVGLAPEQLKRVMRRFERLHSVIAGKPVRGTGLGLYIVDRFARALKGDVTVASDGPGTGSTFSVAIPLGSSTANTVVDRAESLTGETSR